MYIYILYLYHSLFTTFCSAFLELYYLFLQRPFGKKMTKEFMAGQMFQLKKKQEQSDEEEEEMMEESESEYSMVATEIYESPVITPKRLSLIDLTVGTEVTKHDIQETTERGKYLWNKILCTIGPFYQIGIFHGADRNSPVSSHSPYKTHW